LADSLQIRACPAGRWTGNQLTLKFPAIASARQKAVSRWYVHILPRKSVSLAGQPCGSVAELHPPPSSPADELLCRSHVLKHLTRLAAVLALLVGHPSWAAGQTPAAAAKQDPSPD